MDVTDVLRDRLQEPAGLQRMLTVSLLSHLALGAVVIVAPGNFFRHASEAPRTVMTISLAGAAEGPVNGGRTPAAGQPVQIQTPPEELQKREPARPPAAKTPDMVMPAAKARTTKSPGTPVTQAPDDARGRTPTKGTQTTPGNAVAYTGARGQGFGLATGGGAGAGSSLDVADFCCPEYIATMVDRIRSVWQSNQGATGDVLIKFTIQRDGRITDYSVANSSGSPVLDTAALRAVVGTRTLNPLPAQFPNPTLGVRLNFEYR